MVEKNIRGEIMKCEIGVEAIFLDEGRQRMVINQLLYVSYQLV